MKAASLSLVAMILSTAVLVTARGAHAGEPRTHDGFMLRLSAGGGSAGTKVEELGAKIDLSGTAADLNIAIGGMIQPNLALHGTLFGWSMSDPDAEIVIPTIGSGSGTVNGTVTMAAVGGGLTYYAMPINIYFSGSVGIARVSMDGDVSGDTDQGIAFDLTIGKEWWTGDNWGLGLAGGYTYHSVPDQASSSVDWQGSSYSLRFTATMN